MVIRLIRNQGAISSSGIIISNQKGGFDMYSLQCIRFLAVLFYSKSKLNALYYTILNQLILFLAKKFKNRHENLNLSCFRNKI